MLDGRRRSGGRRGRGDKRGARVQEAELELIRHVDGIFEDDLLAELRIIQEVYAGTVDTARDATRVTSSNSATTTAALASVRLAVAH